MIIYWIWFYFMGIVLLVAVCLGISREIAYTSWVNQFHVANFFFLFSQKPLLQGQFSYTDFKIPFYRQLDMHAHCDSLRRATKWIAFCWLVRCDGLWVENRQIIFDLMLNKTSNFIDLLDEQSTPRVWFWCMAIVECAYAFRQQKQQPT